MVSLGILACVLHCECRISSDMVGVLNPTLGRALMNYHQ
jgi:hypothetical protein